MAKKLIFALEKDEKWNYSHGQNLLSKTSTYKQFSDGSENLLKCSNTETQCFEQKSNKHQKKHGKEYHSIKVGTLRDHNPLCLKSFKIMYPM